MNAMSMPISKLFTATAGGLLLSACNNDSGNSLEKAEKEASAQADDNGKIECALAGSTDFTRTCETERIAGPDGQILVIRHSDGGFRRFNILTDGRGLSPAQGADPTNISILNDGQIELSSGDDRYRLPANVKASEPKPSEPEAEKATENQ